MTVSCPVVVHVAAVRPAGERRAIRRAVFDRWYQAPAQEKQVRLITHIRRHVAGDVALLTAVPR
ncbi:hypothetical protein [Nonomuraea rubra]|uniref:hypothetical protein n=1 Tax=Nonomuraea rubra TaxID=46180 RepID=UPI0033F69CAC